MKPPFANSLYAIAISALLAVAAHAKPLYFTGNSEPTVWVGDTGGSSVAPAAVLYSGVAEGVVGIDESEGQLLWATARSTSVVSAPASGPGLPVELANGTADGSVVQLDVAIDRPGGRYFYTVAAGDGGSPGLYQASLDGAGSAQLIDVGVGPTGVLYDATNDYLYYSTNTNVIRRIRPDGTDQEDLIESATDTFCDIAGDFEAGLLYFTESLEEVGVLDLVTRETTTLYDPPGTVRSLDLDPQTQTLYWATFNVNLTGDDAVQSAPADGSGSITTLYEGNFQNLRGIAVSSIPEPGTLALLGLTLTGLTVSRRRKSSE